MSMSCAFRRPNDKSCDGSVLALRPGVTLMLTVYASEMNHVTRGETLWTLWNT